MIVEEAKTLLLRDEYYEYYLTGELKYHFFAIGKMFDGVHKEWYRNGQIASSIEYKMSKLHGTFKQWNMDGELVLYAMFNEGKEVEGYIDVG